MKHNSSERDIMFGFRLFAALCVALFVTVLVSDADAQIRNKTRFQQFGGVYLKAAQEAFGRAPTRQPIRHVRMSQEAMTAAHPEVSYLVAADANKDTYVIRYSGEGWDAASPRVRCALMVHEYGHLLGLGHSDDPKDIMYPSHLNSAAVCQHINVVRIGLTRRNVHKIYVWGITDEAVEDPFLSNQIENPYIVR